MNGLRVAITDCPNVKLLGLEGVVLQEKKNIFIIKCDNNIVVSVPKVGARFRFSLSQQNTIELDGSQLRYAPESRTKKLLKGK